MQTNSALDDDSLRTLNVLAREVEVLNESFPPTYLLEPNTKLVFLTKSPATVLSPVRHFSERATSFYLLVSTETGEIGWIWAHAHAIITLIQE
jgi:hypothetical protein